MKRIVRISKRITDVTLASAGILVSAPLWPLIALAIKADSRGPVFYSQTRYTAHWEPGMPAAEMIEFPIVKFRTMRTDAEAATGATWATEEDPRITKVGKFLRSTRLDELPQLVSVLKGEMSLVGPRPERPAIVEWLREHIPAYDERLLGVKPGITGFAQIHCGYDTSLDSVRNKLMWDLAYVARTVSLRSWLITDISILWRTVAVVVLRKGAH